MAGDNQNGARRGFGPSVLLILAGAVLAEAAGFAFVLDGLPPGFAAPLRLGLVLAGAVFAFIVYWRQLLALLRSLRFGITVLAFLMAAAAVGTLFLQEGQGSHDDFEWPPLSAPDPTGASPAELHLLRKTGAPKDAVERALAESHGDPRAAAELLGFWGAFLQAESSFLWNLLHPLARMDEPPRRRELAIDWLAKRGVHAPEAVADMLLLGDDLAAHERIFGPRAAHEEWRRSRSALRAAAAEAGAHAFLAEHRAALDALFHAARVLGLTRIWHTHWFTALLFLLGLCLALNLRRPGPLTARKAALWLTHGGILIILIGGTASRMFEERGMARLWVGDTVDRIFVPGPGPGTVREAPLRGRLTLTLAAFKADPHHRLQLRVRRSGKLAGELPAGAVRGGYQRTEGVAAGRRFELLPGSADGWQVRVAEFWPRARARREWGAPAEGAGLSVALLAGAPGEPALELIAEPGAPGLRFLPDGVRLALIQPADEAEAQAWMAGQGLDSYGWLRLRFGAGEWTRLPLEPGAAATLEGPGGPVQALVWRVMQNFDLEAWGGRSGIFGERLSGPAPPPDGGADREKNRGLAPERPAAALILEGPQGTGGLYLFAEGPGAIPVPGHAVYRGLETALEFDRLRAPARELVALLSVSEAPRLVRARGGRVVEVAEIREGATFLAGERTFRVERLLRGVAPRLVVEPVAEDGNLFHQDAAAARLSVSGPAGEREITLVAATARQLQRGEGSLWEQADYDANLGLRLVEELQMPKEWRSRLVVRRLDLPRVRTQDGKVLVFPALAEEPWLRLLGALREAGADAAPLERRELFGEQADRERNLEALDGALSTVLAPKEAAFWRERLPKGLCLTLEEWAASSRERPVEQGVIRVNAPLAAAPTALPAWLLGYQFNQSDAKAHIDPDYSGIQVIWDPGVSLVRLGLVLAALGTFLVFLVLPIRRGFRRGEEEA